MRVVGLLALVLVDPWAAHFLLLRAFALPGSQFPLVRSLRARVLLVCVARSVSSCFGMGELLRVAPLIEVPLAQRVAG